MKVVVTGGAGFIGANLVRTLRVDEPDWDVHVVDDLSTGARINLHGVDGLTLHHASILDCVALDEAFSDADAVVHLAARPSVQRSVHDPLATHDINATGTVRVLDAARRAAVAHLVVASSSSVYGATTALPLHEALPTCPVSPYAASKLATESYARAYAHCYGMRVLTFRFFNVFGPLQSTGHAYSAAIPAFIAAALDNRPIVVYGDGLQSRDFTYVGTVCEVVTDALRRRVADDHPLNLAFGTRHTLLDVVDELSSLLGRPLTRVHRAARRGDMWSSQADGTRLGALFPGIVPIDLTRGLDAMVRWHVTGMSTSR
jgi:UDP-glucose 4-epimerase